MGSVISIVHSDLPVEPVTSRDVISYEHPAYRDERRRQAYDQAKPSERSYFRFICDVVRRRARAPDNGRETLTFGSFHRQFRSEDRVELAGVTTSRHDLVERLETIDPTGSVTCHLMCTTMSATAAFETGTTMDFLLRRIAELQVENAALKVKAVTDVR